MPDFISSGGMAGSKSPVLKSPTVSRQVEEPVQVQAPLHGKVRSTSEDVSDPSESVLGVNDEQAPRMEVDCEEEDWDDEKTSGALFALCGYRHCASEAVRYLVEEENLSPDDPLVLGLLNHLWASENLNSNVNAIRSFVEGSESEEESNEGSAELSDPMETIFRMALAIDCRTETSSDKRVWNLHGASRAVHEDTAAPDSLSLSLEQRDNAPCSPSPSI